MEEFGMNFLEKDLEEIIFTSDKEKLDKRGLFVNQRAIFKRQLKIGNYGISDLITYQRPFLCSIERVVYKGQINVYELKKEKISVSSFLQALNYLKGIRSYLNKKGIEDNYDYKIILIGKEFDIYSSFAYMPDIISSQNYDDSLGSLPIFSTEFYTYEYGLEGIFFKQISGYKLINEGF
jgi:hypothetical protein